MYKSYEIRAEAQRVEEARMSKLTEIKERLDDLQRCRGREWNEALEEFRTYAESDIDYLLSLLEEKDKALAFYADEKTYDLEHLSKFGYVIIDKDNGDIARTALNTTKEET